MFLLLPVCLQSWINALLPFYKNLSLSNLDLLQQLKHTGYSRTHTFLAGDMDLGISGLPLARIQTPIPPHILICNLQRVARRHFSPGHDITMQFNLRHRPLLQRKPWACGAGRRTSLPVAASSQSQSLERLNRSAKSKVLELIAEGPLVRTEDMEPALRELLYACPIKKEETAMQALGPVGQGTWEVRGPFARHACHDDSVPCKPHCTCTA